MSEEKFLDNLASAWRMYSARFVFAFSTLGAYFLSLPVTCPAENLACLNQTEILSHLFLPAWLLPYLLGFIPFIVFRALPQRNMTEALAVKKSAEAPVESAPQDPDAATRLPRIPQPLSDAEHLTARNGGPPA